MDLADAFALAEHLLERHGLHDWSVEYDAAKRRAGICRFGPRVIGLSAPLTALHGEVEVRDTILHEIAHALVGPRHGHDAVWRRQAVAIGCSGQRCTPETAEQVQTAWLGVCSAGHTTGRHRRPERVVSCARCSSTFNLAHVLTWTHHGLPAQHHPNYEAELARLVQGDRVRWLRVGARARVVAPGESHDLVGRVVKIGRTSYHVRAGRTVVRVPFAWVEPA